MTRPKGRPAKSQAPIGESELSAEREAVFAIAQEIVTAGRAAMEERLPTAAGRQLLHEAALLLRIELGAQRRDAERDAC